MHSVERYMFVSPKMIFSRYIIKKILIHVLVLCHPCMTKSCRLCAYHDVPEDDCTSGRCLHQAVCQDDGTGSAGFACLCQPGYKGDDCRTGMALFVRLLICPSV